ncbi:hypothetical protein BJV74DRAFT_814735 [Russula compacta]|nr:hypothetical protein BJV74DRAFT_814735 [Russula compacta]
MFTATIWHRVLRPANSVFPNNARILQSHALHNTSVHKFRATDFFSATHRTASSTGHARGDRKPPGLWQRLSRRFNRIPANYIVFGVLGINGVVFAGWSYVQIFRGTVHARPPSAKWLARWLQDNFINSYENLREGRFWTLVTSTFSHTQPGHALLNGLTFWFLAPTALAVLGNTQFLVLYLTSGAFASLSSLAWNTERNYHSHGASGAIYALASFFAFAAPRAQFLLFFVLPMPAWACIGGIACFDVYNAFTRRFSTLDSAGHVGGLTAGALYWMMRARFRLL